MSGDSSGVEVKRTTLYCPSCDRYYWYPDEQDLEEGDQCPNCFEADLDRFITQEGESP